ncbi:hypothetical protein TBR22_A00190 [Luteitalea sp. TBR-22]|uniref:hypothetical protein n=1 Tax=Luteitalea sp. TBR-22 TaxID=2802971 RepID=UPI001AF71B0C|nr:hypothetical protein [Luteitalea sp. TBR-22]BCS30819.1 hypothetical protein TBR22_A00190 [Luteitalea sp. TBR-22]
MTHNESSAASSSPSVTQRRVVSQVGAPIRLERLTLSRPIRDAIARQFVRVSDPRATPSPAQ